MDKKWFEVKLRYNRTDESGKTLRTSDAFLIKAESFADAEGRVAELGLVPDGDYEVDAVKKNKVSEVFRGDGEDVWYLAKVGLITFDERSGAEKVSAISCYVEAENIDKALDGLRNGMNGTISDWKVMSISETNILGVYDFEA